MQKKTVHLIMFAIFLVISSLFINPRVSTTSASFPGKQIKTRTTTEKNSQKTDFIDNNGNIIMAENLGYATVIITTNNREETESYFDEYGNPTVLKAGYGAVKREYDENGNNIYIVYLGTDGKPVSIRNGYASEIRQFNQKGQMTSVRYYDVTGQPTCFKYFGYGKIMEYDENGHQRTVTYINPSGEPMLTQEGYATVKRTYYLTEGPENGKVEREFYFDVKGKPVSLRLGQYGLQYQYDEYGRSTVLTYLDAEGCPKINHLGYATVRRSFFDNNQVSGEQYYDQYGNPCSLSEGQFGFRWKDGKRIYLDENGNEQKSLKNFLYTHSWMVIVIAIAVMILSVMSDRIMNICLLIICILTIIYLTLMNRNNISMQSGIGLFSSFWRMVFDRESRANVLRNIWLFIPMGAILHSLYPRKKVLFIPVAFSIVIETIQYLTGIGYCDPGDVLCNCFGGITGFVMADRIKDMKRLFQKRKQQSAHVDI